MDPEIRALTHAYAHCVWRKDVEGIVPLFAPDGAVDMGNGTVRGGRRPYGKPMLAPWPIKSSSPLCTITCCR